MTETVSLLELLVAIMLLVGLLITGRSLYLVIGDLLQLKEKENYVPGGVRHIQAKGHIRTEARKFITMAAFLFAVIVLMDYPPRQGNAYHFGTLSVMFAILLTLIMMIIDTLLYLLDREKILKELDEQVNRSTPVDTTHLTSRVTILEDGRGVLQVPVRVEKEEK